MPFIIESPKIVIDHNMPLQSILQEFPQGMLRCITPQYYNAKCVVFNGIVCMVGFHFTPKKRTPEPLLEKLEFYRPENYVAKSYSERDTMLRQSFLELQQRLESLYGPPTVVRVSDYDPAYAWQCTNMRIRHSLYNRYSLEETLFIYLD